MHENTCDHDFDSIGSILCCYLEYNMHHTHEQEDKEGNILTHLGSVRGWWYSLWPVLFSEHVTIDRVNNKLMIYIDRRF